MFEFSKNIASYVEDEIASASQARAKGDAMQEFKHLEIAHVLGQESTYYHTKVHWLMFLWGWRQHNAKEVLGQCLRLVGAMTKTALGLVPSGNTGGSNISPFRRLPINAKQQAIIERAKAKLK